MHQIKGPRRPDAELSATDKG